MSVKPKIELTYAFLRGKIGIEQNEISTYTQSGVTYKMKVIGYQLLSSSSSQRKHYTVLVTDTGYLIKHNGGRKMRPSPQRGYSLSSGSADFVILGTKEQRNLALELEKTYNAKAQQAEYDSAYITSEPIEVSDVAFMSAASAREITTEFYEKVTTPGIMGIDSYMSMTRPVDLQDYDEAFARFGRGIADDDVDPVMDRNGKPVAATPSSTHFTTVEEGKVIRPNGEEYRVREVLGHTDVALLREFRKKSIYVRLAGPPGGGKTALAEAAFGKELITITGHGDMTVANFVGTWIPRRHRAAGESEWEWVDGPLTRAMKEGCPFFVDEGTRIPTEVMNILFSAMDGRKVLRLDDRPDMEPVHAAEGFYVIMGYNPDTLGARALDEALTSRFLVQINVYTDHATARALGVPSDAIKIAAKMQTKDKEDRAADGLGCWIPQMRELLSYRNLIDMGVGQEFALATLIASCPREMDIPNLVAAVKEVTGKEVSLPTLGGLV